MPFPGFLHSMNTVLQTAIIDSVFDEGRRPVPNQSTHAQDVLPSDYVIPGPIYEYCSNLGSVITLPDDQFPAGFGDLVGTRHLHFTRTLSLFCSVSYLFSKDLDYDTRNKLSACFHF